MNIEIDREVLHQMARRVTGDQERVLSTVMLQKMATAAQRIADATAIPENGPVTVISI